MIQASQHFNALPEDKKDRILRAALREFGRYGYRKTSVEQIAVSADISKGMIFHYFGNKQQLFEFLTGYAYQKMIHYFSGLTEKIQSLDYIEQFRLSTKLKLQGFTDNQQVFEFFTMLYLHPENTQISPLVLKYYEKLMDYRQKVFSQIISSENPTPFREDIPVTQIKRYVAWLLEGYTQEIMARIGSASLADVELADTWAEFDRILTDLKQIFYQPANA